jgi:hypothetical protein
MAIKIKEFLSKFGSYNQFHTVWLIRRFTKISKNNVN